MSIEILTWHKPSQGVLPNTDRNVLARTDSPRAPVWPAWFRDGEWSDPDGLPLCFEVFEWSEMPGGTGGQQQARHIASGGDYAVVTREVRFKPDGAEYFQDGVLYASKGGDLFVRSVEAFDDPARFEPLAIGQVPA
jgi:hypothetical protein